RIVRKKPGESLRHIVSKDILLDAIPYAEQKMSSGLQDTPGFAVGGRAVGKEHRAELTANEVEGRIFKRQRQGIRLAPLDAAVGSLSGGGVVEHRLVEVGDHIARAGGEFWRQGAGDNPGARAGLQNGAWRQGRRPPCKIRGVWLENQRNHIAVVILRNRSGERLVRFQHRCPRVSLIAAEAST